MSSADKYAAADKLQAQADALRQEAHDERIAEGRALPLAERLIYAAEARCPCGAGLAYDPFANDDPIFRGPTFWDCSAIILGTAETDGFLRHTDRLPFAFYEIKSERQPSARGVTTRPAEVLPTPALDKPVV
jgi:hypothetical protein